MTNEIVGLALTFIVFSRFPRRLAKPSHAHRRHLVITIYHLLPFDRRYHHFLAVLQIIRLQHKLKEQTNYLSSSFIRCTYIHTCHYGFGVDDGADATVCGWRGH